MNAKQRVLAPRRSQLAVSTACCGRGARFAIAQDARRGDHGYQRPGIRGISVKILWSIFLLIKGERPLAFFSGVSAALAASSVGLAAPIAMTFIETGLVPRLPTAVLAMGIMLLAFLSLASGFVLDTVTRGRTEMKRLHYLRLPAPGQSAE